MDIHRCRFVPYRPQSINTLVFSHRPNPKQKTPQDLRLAIGRENGDVEIWNPLTGNWVQEKILRGSKDRTIEQLVWTQDLIVDEDNPGRPLDDGLLRLFSSGGSPSITEWNIATGQQKRQAEGTVADVWCFAAQPQWKRSGKEQALSNVAGAPSQLLAAGCSDGSIVLFSTADDTLQFLRMLTPAFKRMKVISITWRDRNTVVAGYEAGFIRVIDVPTRSVVRQMSLGKPIDGNKSVVWALRCLPDGTIVSGDSSGELKIWDSKTLSLAQRFKAHDADILDIAASANGDTLITAGVDRRVTVFKQQSSPAGNKKERWQRLVHRRFHQHDVKSLATFEAKGMSVVVSGGTDTIPIVMPLRNWDTEYHRSLPHLPQRPQMSCSSKVRLMLTWWGRELFIWNLPEAATVEVVEQASLDGINHQLLARIELKGDENISSAQISENGEMIVVATIASVKMFQIRKRFEAGDIEVRTRPIDLPLGIRSFGASLVGFSPDSKWVFCVRTSNIVSMTKIVSDASGRERPQLQPQVTKLGRKKRGADTASLKLQDEYLQSINCVSFSSDSRIIATGDLVGAIDVWVLEGHEDLQDVTAKNATSDSDSSSDSDADSDSDSDDDESDSRVIHGQKWIRNPSGSSLPQLDSCILALGFKPHLEYFQPPDASLGLHATRHNPHPVAHELPPSDTQLVAVTASHQIIEFDIMSSKISDWSKRNPSTCLPQSFTKIKDRAMGIFWDYDYSIKRQRLWLYGSMWLFMLDMNRDLSVVDAQDKIGQIGDYDVREPLPDTPAAKRMMVEPTPLGQRKKRKQNMGAGDQKKANEFLFAPPVQPSTDVIDIDTGLLSPASDNEYEGEIKDEDVGMGIESTNTLTQLRRKADAAQLQDFGLDTTDPASSHTQAQPPSPSHLTIFRYRSIFGISALRRAQPDPSPNQDDSTSIQNASLQLTTQANATTPITALAPTSNLEIVLAERPIYDVDFLPRFDGGQDWST